MAAGPAAEGTVAMIADRLVILEVSMTAVQLRDLHAGAMIGDVPDHPVHIYYPVIVAVGGTTYVVKVAADHDPNPEPHRALPSMNPSAQASMDQRVS